MSDIYHLSKPEQSDSKAEMHTNGSNAARKSVFSGTSSSLEVTTSRYDAPQRLENAHLGLQVPAQLRFKVLHERD